MSRFAALIADHPSASSSSGSSNGHDANADPIPIPPLPSMRIRMMNGESVLVELGGSSFPQCTLGDLREAIFQNLKIAPHEQFLTVDADDPDDARVLTDLRPTVQSDSQKLHADLGLTEESVLYVVRQDLRPTSEKNEAMLDLIAERRFPEAYDVLWYTKLYPVDANFGTGTG